MVFGRRVLGSHTSPHELWQCFELEGHVPERLPVRLYARTALASCPQNVILGTEI